MENAAHSFQSLEMHLVIDTHRNNETHGILFGYGQETSLRLNSFVSSLFARSPVYEYYERNMDPHFAFALKVGKQVSQ